MDTASLRDPVQESTLFKIEIKSAATPQIHSIYMKTDFLFCTPIAFPYHSSLSLLFNYTIFEVKSMAGSSLYGAAHLTWWIIIVPDFLWAEWMDIEYISLSMTYCLRLFMSFFQTSITDNQRLIDISVQFLQYPLQG